MLKIREFRKRRNLTIKELSSLSGMSISYISQVERGEIDPSLSSLRKIAAVFQVPLYTLLDDAEMMEDLTLRKSCQKNPVIRKMTASPSAFCLRFPPQNILLKRFSYHFEIAPHAQDVTEPVRTILKKSCT